MVNGMKVARRVVHVLGDRAGAQHDPERVEQDASVDEHLRKATSLYLPDQTRQFIEVVEPYWPHAELKVFR